MAIPHNAWNGALLRGLEKPTAILAELQSAQ